MGPYADEFRPGAHQTHYDKLNALGTFAGGDRVCRGKSVPLAIINYFTAAILTEFNWSARGDGDQQHPTEFNFNNGVVGKIEYRFSPKKSNLVHQETTPTDLQALRFKVGYLLRWVKC